MLLWDILLSPTSDHSVPEFPALAFDLVPYFPATQDVSVTQETVEFLLETYCKVRQTSNSILINLHASLGSTLPHILREICSA